MSDAKKFIQENALDVIEKFGGIRPMATKLGIAVTTVQGWKKRESIPDSRIDDVIKTAQEFDIILSSSNENVVKSERPNIEDTIAQIKAKIEQPEEQAETPDEDRPEILEEETGESDEEVEEESDSSQSDSVLTITPITENVDETEEVVQNDDSEEEEEKTLTAAEPDDTSSMRAPEKQAANNNEFEDSDSKEARKGWLLPVMFGVIVVALAAIFWPVREDVQENSERLAEVEAELDVLKEEQDTFMNALGGYIPEDMKAQLEDFQKRTGELGEQVGELAQQTQEIATTVIGEENAAEIEKRLQELENQFSGLMSSSQIQSILSRFSEMNDTEEGQSKLDRATGQLYGIVDGLNGRMDLLDQALISARENSTALGETFDGVADEDLKAGALLLGLSQFRSALNRGETPFEEDLELIYSMIGEENTELRQSLDRLAPQAANGVLTPTGLASEFRGLAGDIAVNSLKGEDASVTDQAKARLSKVLQIKKDGEPLLTDETQVKVDQVQGQLDSGDLRGAMSTLSTFEGGAAESVGPFVEQLRSTIAAQEVKQAINSMLRSTKNEFSRVKPLNLKNLQRPTMRQQLTPNQVVTDKDSGVTILPQNRLKNNFKDLNIQIQE